MACEVICSAVNQVELSKAWRRMHVLTCLVPAVHGKAQSSIAPEPSSKDWTTCTATSHHCIKPVAICAQLCTAKPRNLHTAAMLCTCHRPPIPQCSYPCTQPCTALAPL